MSSIFEKWKRGETVKVKNPRNGLVFSIQPYRWERFTLGYTILIDDKPVKGERNKQMGDADFRDWVSNLIEVVE